MNSGAAFECYINCGENKEKIGDKEVKQCASWGSSHKGKPTRGGDSNQAPAKGFWVSQRKGRKRITLRLQEKKDSAARDKRGGVFTRANGKIAKWGRWRSQKNTATKFIPWRKTVPPEELGK